jgi:hypothetical protein
MTSHARKQQAKSAAAQSIASRAASRLGSNVVAAVGDHLLDTELQQAQSRVAQLTSEVDELHAAAQQSKEQLQQCQDELAASLLDLFTAEAAKQAAQQAQEQLTAQLAESQAQQAKLLQQVHQLQLDLGELQLSKQEKEIVSIVRRWSVSATHLRAVAKDGYGKQKPGPKAAAPSEPRAGAAFINTQLGRSPKSAYRADFFMDLWQTLGEQGLAAAQTPAVLPASKRRKAAHVASKPAAPKAAASKAAPKATASKGTTQRVTRSSTKG